MTAAAQTIDIQHLQTWIGREESDQQIIDQRTVAQMAGTLALEQAPGAGDALPMPWHWLLFNPIPHALATGEDGHPAKGGFLPPVPLPRRMWAGSQLTCHQPLLVGNRVKRISRIEKVEAKSGRSGQLVFVTVVHRIVDENEQPLITESQDLVYRYAEATTVAKKPTGPSQPYSAPIPAQWRQSFMPDPVLMFRYAALTFNGHRIHYDRDYALNQEGYPGLVVQGPLTASLLLNLLYQQLPDALIKSFSFRGVKPLFDFAAIQLEGAIDNKTVHLWALTPDQQLAMSLELELQ